MPSKPPPAGSTSSRPPAMGPPSPVPPSGLPSTGLLPSTAPASPRWLVAETGEGGPPTSRPPASMPPTPRPGSFRRGSGLNFNLVGPAARVISELLAVDATDRLIVAHDAANEDAARAFEFFAAQLGARVDRVDWEALAPRPWSSVPPALLALLHDATATILAITDEDGEYEARYAFLIAAMSARARHVHMLGASRKAFLGAMTAACARVSDLNAALREAMRPGSRLAVRSPAGTDCVIELAPHLRWFANGPPLRPREWLTMPYGALSTSPSSVTGVYVADAALGSGCGTRAGVLTHRPVRLTLEGGRVRSVECRDAALRQDVERFLASGPGHDRVGLLTLGTNVGILAPLGEIGHDEHLPGAHLSLGENFPGRTGATWAAKGMLAFASGPSDVTLDDEPLILRGRYVRFG